MTLLLAILLGIIQGLAEFLPISSSGHLSIFQNIFGLKYNADENMMFDVLLHLGTLAAVCIYYRKDIVEVVKGFIETVKNLGKNGNPEKRPAPGGRLAIMIIIATLPLIIVLPFNSKIELLYNNTIFIGCALIFTGFVLFLGDRIHRGNKNERNMRVLDAVIVGFCQAIATFPGVSRSGMTISSGLATGCDRDYAVKFSFLLSIPAVLGANLLTLVKALADGIVWKQMPIYLIGMVIAGVVGYFALVLVNKLIRSSKFGYFSYYCWGVGIITVIVTLIMNAVAA